MKRTTSGTEMDQLASRLHGVNAVWLLMDTEKARANIELLDHVINLVAMNIRDVAEKLEVTN